MTNIPPTNASFRWYYANANNQPVGPLSTEALHLLLQNGTINPNTFIIQEGGKDWQPFSTYFPTAPKEASKTPPIPAQAPAKPIETNVKQGAVIGGWVCFVLAALLMLLSMWSFFFYVPLFIVAAILSIVAMAQRRVLGGVLLLLTTLIVPAILGLVLFTSRTAKFAEKLHQNNQTPIAAVATNGASQSAKKATKNRDADSSATASNPQPIAPVNTTHQSSGEKNGSGGFHLGAPLFTTEDADAKKQMIGLMNNGRHIHIATMSMANDGAVNSDSSLGWPGDLKAAGKIKNLSDFVNTLAAHDYLKPGDLKVFSSEGLPCYPQNGVLDSAKKLNPAFAEDYSAFKVYLVKDDDSPDTIFLASKNFTYGDPLDDTSKPFGDKGFIIGYKRGDFKIFKARDAQNLSLIGKLPGGGTRENFQNCLNPADTPHQSKYPVLDEKNGFRNFRLGEPLASFANVRMEKSSNTEDETWYNIQDFDKKVGNGEISGIRLVFAQNILKRIIVNVSGEMNQKALEQAFIAAYGQPKNRTQIVGNLQVWEGDHVVLTIESSMSVTATFSNKDVAAKIQQIIDQKAKAGAVDGAKNL